MLVLIVGCMHQQRLCLQHQCFVHASALQCLCRASALPHCLARHACTRSALSRPTLTPWPATRCASRSPGTATPPTWQHGRRCGAGAAAGRELACRMRGCAGGAQHVAQPGTCWRVQVVADAHALSCPRAISCTPVLRLLQGRTGFPWIDAAMRQLAEWGWMHHLARHSVACFLTRGDLFLSWTAGKNVFEELLLDAVRRRRARVPRALHSLRRGAHAPILLSLTPPARLATRRTTFSTPPTGCGCRLQPSSTRTTACTRPSPLVRRQHSRVTLCCALVHAWLHERRDAPGASQRGGS